MFSHRQTASVCDDGTWSSHLLIAPHRAEPRASLATPATTPKLAVFSDTTAQPYLSPAIGSILASTPGMDRCLHHRTILFASSSVNVIRQSQ